MPILTHREAAAFWKRGHARSLAATHYCHQKTGSDGKVDDSYRRATSEAIRSGAVIKEAPGHHSAFVERLAAQGARVLHARLEARLILNAAGGVFENGGICLDRHSGIPFIPGSAIKGCARRFALWELSQIETIPEKATKIARLCLAFGYGDTEWKRGRHEKKQHAHSDFWLAMVPLEDAGPDHDAKRDEAWTEVSELAGRRIAEHLAMAEPPRQLQGRIAFLPAFPEQDPGIDLDVITCHHPEYYAGNQDTATDDEDPKPLIFPAVAKGATFRFPLMPLQSGAEEILDHASHFLVEGLQQFGLGAKTNAGYGWFRIDQAAARRDQEKKEIAAISQSGPDEELTRQVRELHEKKQLQSKLNAYALEESMIERLWPRDSTIAFELALFEFVREHSPDLAASKKGSKAMSNLSRKLNRPLE